jgi:hypothetical protein
VKVRGFSSVIGKVGGHSIVCFEEMTVRGEPKASRKGLAMAASASSARVDEGRQGGLRLQTGMSFRFCRGLEFLSGCKKEA